MKEILKMLAGIVAVILCLTVIYGAQMYNEQECQETAYLYDAPLKRNELINYEVGEIRIA